MRLSFSFLSLGLFSSSVSSSPSDNNNKMGHINSSSSSSLGSFPGSCVAPAVCEAPEHAVHSLVRPVQSRQQWEISGGFCGSLSIQAIAMSYGAYISQREVRRAAGPGGGHGDKQDGYEILHTNIGGALDTLKLTHDDWDYTQPLPQTEEYLSWLKSELASGHPVVWMIMCKGDGHDTYGLANYDHVEPVWGLFSNHSLDDTTVYPDDVLVHGSDYGAYHKIQGPSLYRRFDQLADSKKMDGNCSIAQEGVGHNEYYPCVPNDGRDWGFAITGVANASSTDVPVSLAVDRFDEPNVEEGQDPVQLHGTVTVGPGLKDGETYDLYTWTDAAHIPADGDYAKSQYTRKTSFKATGDSHVFKDPQTIASDGVTFYRAQASSAE